jgi:hypothetical protein
MNDGIVCKSGFLNVSLFTTATRAATHHREDDEQEEANEGDDDADLNRYEQEADERDKLAHQSDEQNDERDDSAEATENFEKS